jgi:hypothetical protein
MTKEIPLTKGMVALVDDEDYYDLSKYRWYANKTGWNTYYAFRNTPRQSGKQHLIRMHRVILNPPSDMEVDHINGNGLDNRKENLRIVTRRQNSQNRHQVKTSKYTGVCWDNDRQKWRAYIRIMGRNKHLGLFVDETLAARAYMRTVNWVTGDGTIEPGSEQGVCA